jgi:hypothetical protein
MVRCTGAGDPYENGRIVEHWDVVDTLARAVALGLVAPPK